MDSCKRRRLAADEGARALIDADVEVEARAKDVRAQQAPLARLPEGEAQPLHRERVLVPDVDVAGHRPVVRADRVGGDDHPLDDAVRVAFEHRAVHESAGVALVGVTDDVVDVAGIAAGRPPLLAGGEARSTAASQPAPFDLVDDGDGVAIGKHFRQGGVAAVG